MIELRSPHCDEPERGGAGRPAHHAYDDANYSAIEVVQAAPALERAGKEVYEGGTHDDEQ